MSAGTTIGTGSAAALGQIPGWLMVPVVVIGVMGGLVVTIIQATFPQESDHRLQVWRMLDRWLTGGRGRAPRPRGTDEAGDVPTSARGRRSAGRS